MRLTRSNLGSFGLGLSNFIYFRSFGVIIFLEIVAIFSIAIRILSTKRNNFIPSIENKNFLRKFYLFGFVWFVFQYLSDLMNHSQPSDTKKLLAQIIVLLVLVYWGQTWFQVRDSRLTWFVLGYALSAVPNYFLTPTAYITYEPWKFCFGPGFTILVFLWFSKSRLSLPIQSLVILSLTYFDFRVGSRALALVTILSWILSLIGRKDSFQKTKAILSILGVILVGALTSNIYHNLALSGHFGTIQQTKTIQQFGSGPLLLVARSELLFELSGIRRNLLLGTGSNPNITTDIINQVDQFNSRLGVDSGNTAAFNYARTTGKIPQHSLLFSFWLFGGIPAALFWIYLFFELTKWVLRTKFQNSKYFYLSRFLYVGFVWNFLFSPLGAGQRVLLALTIAVIFYDHRDSMTVITR